LIRKPAGAAAARPTKLRQTQIKRQERQRGSAKHLTAATDLSAQITHRLVVVVVVAVLVQQAMITQVLTADLAVLAW